MSNPVSESRDFRLTYLFNIFDVEVENFDPRQVQTRLVFGVFQDGQPEVVT